MHPTSLLCRRSALHNSAFLTLGVLAGLLVVNLFLGNMWTHLLTKRLRHIISAIEDVATLRVESLEFCGESWVTEVERIQVVCMLGAASDIPGAVCFTVKEGLSGAFLRGRDFVAKCPVQPRSVRPERPSLACV